MSRFLGCASGKRYKTSEIEGQLRYSYFIQTVLQFPSRVCVDLPHIEQQPLDVACLTERPSNKIWLHTVCHVVTETDLVSWNHLRAVSRACTSRHCARRFLVFGYE